MEHIVVDLEATCWEESPHDPAMEIIEIGAVRLDSRLEFTGDEFAVFVKPVVRPVLSDFCKTLTTIAQHDVDDAEEFPHGFSAFNAWIGSDDYFLCSWGDYDRGQFIKDCERHAVALPPPFASRHVNIKRVFQQRYGMRKGGVSKALAHLGMTFEGTQHRGLDDARNIARIYKHAAGND